MPDLISVGLGGGTIVRRVAGDTCVGPDSVGYRLITEALVVGGSTPTLSDVSVKLGRLSGFGDPALDDRLDDSIARQALAWVDSKVQTLRDRMKRVETPSR